MNGGALLPGEEIGFCPYGASVFDHGSRPPFNEQSRMQVAFGARKVQGRRKNNFMNRITHADD